jgi:molybdopterin converting factor small subunit
MSIRVRWFATLVKRTRSKQAMTAVDWRAGLTPLAIFLDEGFDQADAEPVMAIVNGTQTTMEAALSEGDEVEYLVGISGG